MSTRDAIVDIGGKVMSSSHKLLLRLSGGRVLRTAFGMPAVELHTVGRRSGKPRSTMLTTPVHDDDRLVLVASKGGDDRHPAWYLNLVANPEVQITVGGSTQRYLARTAGPEEKAELWPQITAAYKGYAGYQERTERDIPVVVCERVAD